MKKKLCAVKGCKERFYPQYNTTQAVCSPICAIKLVEQKKAEKKKKQRKIDKLKLEALQPRSYWLKKAEKTCNKYIRERDKNKSCISCGITYGKREAGHYRSVGSCHGTRFHPYNIHVQCSQCNCSKGGNLINYRINLVKLIGVEIVEYLENFNILQHWTIDEIKEIEAHYKDKFKQL